MNRLGLAGLALLLLARCASAQPRRVAVVAEEGEPLRGAIVRGLAAPPNVALRVVTFKTEDLADPIRRGELIARLSASDLIVPIGDSATALVLDETEDVPVFFVGAGVVPGRRLGTPSVSGLLAYDPLKLLDAAGALGRGRLGLAYTQGYDALATRLGDAARERGVPLEAKRVESARAIPAVVGGLLGRCRVVWLLGDPLLDRGAGFEFAAERSLSLRVPLVAVDAWAVRHGAFLGSEPDAAPLAEAASRGIGVLTAGGKAGERLQAAPATRLLVNGALSRAWGLKPAAESGWHTIQ